jgi:hypothetical protein
MEQQEKQPVQPTRTPYQRKSKTIVTIDANGHKVAPSPIPASTPINATSSKTQIQLIVANKENKNIAKINPDIATPKASYMQATVASSLKNNNMILQPKNNSINSSDNDTSQSFENSNTTNNESNNYMNQQIKDIEMLEVSLTQNRSTTNNDSFSPVTEYTHLANVKIQTMQKTSGLNLDAGSLNNV